MYQSFIQFCCCGYVSVSLFCYMITPTGYTHNIRARSQQHVCNQIIIDAFDPVLPNPNLKHVKNIKRQGNGAAKDIYFIWRVEGAHSSNFKINKNGIILFLRKASCARTPRKQARSMLQHRQLLSSNMTISITPLSCYHPSIRLGR